MKSADIRRPMMRCTSCSHWQSGHPRYASTNEVLIVRSVDENGELTRTVPKDTCGNCGAQLAEVDMAAHTAALPQGYEAPTGGVLVEQKPKSRSLG